MDHRVSNRTYHFQYPTVCLFSHIQNGRREAWGTVIQPKLDPLKRIYRHPDTWAECWKEERGRGREGKALAFTYLMSGYFTGWGREGGENCFSKEAEKLFQRDQEMGISLLLRRETDINIILLYCWRPYCVSYQSSHLCSFLMLVLAQCFLFLKVVVKFHRAKDLLFIGDHSHLISNFPFPLSCVFTSG